MRKGLVVLAAGMVSVLAGCVGQTFDPTDVRATRATVQAYGHTNNGPASWWWEYGISRKAVAGGQGTKTPKSGPAQSASDLTLSFVLTGLDRAQGYFFRACGQDQAAGSPALCGAVREFHTAQGDSTVENLGDHTRYVGSPDATHYLELGVNDGTNQVEITELDRDFTTPPASSDFLVSGSGCHTHPEDNHTSYHNVAACTPNTYLELGLPGTDDVVFAQEAPEAVNATMGAGDDIYFGFAQQFQVINGGPGNDQLQAQVGSAAAQLYGDDGNDYLLTADGSDILHGGKGNDELHGGAGVDSLYGEDGNDTLYSGPGTDGLACGPGDDTVHVDDISEFNNHATGCEHVVIDGQ